MPTRGLLLGGKCVLYLSMDHGRLRANQKLRGTGTMLRGFSPCKTCGKFCKLAEVWGWKLAARRG